MEGVAEGTAVDGTADGLCDEGTEDDGTNEGLAEVGIRDGRLDDGVAELGLEVGWLVDGEEVVGITDGIADGLLDGTGDGTADGSLVDGATVGNCDGRNVGLRDGLEVGRAEGAVVGNDVEEQFVVGSAIRFSEYKTVHIFVSIAYLKTTVELNVPIASTVILFAVVSLVDILQNICIECK